MAASGSVPALDSVLFNMAPPNAASALNLGGSRTPDEIAERRRKLMAAASGGANDTLSRYAGISSSLFGQA